MVWMRKRGLAGLHYLATLLNENIDFLNLIDVKSFNGIYNWINRRRERKQSSEILDRFLVSCFWLSNR